MEYKCSKCGLAVIVVDETTVIRACIEECKNEPITVAVEATVYSKSKTDA